MKVDNHVSPGKAFPIILSSHRHRVKVIDLVRQHNQIDGQLTDVVPCIN